MMQSPGNGACLFDPVFILETTMLSAYRQRRCQLMQQLQQGVAVVFTASLAVRNADCHYPFRADSDFLYLTGFDEPEACIVLDAAQNRSILFCREKNPERELWEGLCLGPEAAKDILGFDEAYPIAELANRLPMILAEKPMIWWKQHADIAAESAVEVALACLQQSSGQAIEVDRFGHLLPVLHEMRVVKDTAELSLLRQAGKISALAHCQAMRSTRPGMLEYQVEAELLHTFIHHGARCPAYESIVAGGANACTLHYTANKDVLRSGDLLLIDAGCEWQGYAGDISRTFPVNGKFSGPQRDVYQIVLEAQLAAIEMVRAGRALNEPADAALKILAQGMLDLGLLKGSVSAVIESGAYRQFYMHGIGHFVGLDVHDAGARKVNEQWRHFLPGMCTTIEPGLYIRPADNVPEALHHIGIRIEDNVLVTEQGNEVYTADVPKTIEGIEALMCQ